MDKKDRERSQHEKRGKKTHFCFLSKRKITSYRTCVFYNNSKVIIQTKPTLHGSITPFGRKRVQDPYVQRRVVCPQKAVTQNIEKKITNQYALNGTKRKRSISATYSHTKELKCQSERNSIYFSKTLTDWTNKM